MRYLTVFVVVFLSFSFSHAYATIKSCDELKNEIASKLDAVGVQAYTLLIEENEMVDEDIREDRGEVVGTCEGGAKRIIYIKEEADPALP